MSIKIPEALWNFLGSALVTDVANWMLWNTKRRELKTISVYQAEPYSVTHPSFLPEDEGRLISLLWAVFKAMKEAA